jgi:hypothetical protein
MQAYNFDRFNFNIALALGFLSVTPLVWLDVWASIHESYPRLERGTLAVRQVLMWTFNLGSLEGRNLSFSVDMIFIIVTVLKRLKDSIWACPPYSVYGAKLENVEKRRDMSIQRRRMLIRNDK